jgi:hypothetical protein
MAVANSRGEPILKEDKSQLLTGLGRFADKDLKDRLQGQKGGA